MDTPKLLILIISNVQTETTHYYFNTFPSTYLNLSKMDNLAITFKHVVVQLPQILNLDLVKEIIILFYYPIIMAYSYPMYLCFKHFELL